MYSQYGALVVSMADQVEKGDANSAGETNDEKTEKAPSDDFGKASLFLHVYIFI